MEKVLITGGTGLIGRRLSKILSAQGYEICWLSRNPAPNAKYRSFTWNIEQGKIEENTFENLNYIIHLAGAGIADNKWTDQRKKIILDSRVASTKLLYHYIQKLQIPLKAFISSSAIGYYGSVTSEIIFKEDDNSGGDFIAKVCKLWEQAIFEFEANKIRTIAIRTGIVLSNKGGALAKMKTPVITPLGNGFQYMPWIHMLDMVRAIVYLVETPHASGEFNVCAPHPVTNKTFSRSLAKALKRPHLLFTPKWILKLMMGESSCLLFDSLRAKPKKLTELGFIFAYSRIEPALKNFLQNQN